MGDNNNSADRKRQLQLWVSPSRSAPQGGCLAGPRMLDVCSPGSHKSLAIRGRRGYPVFTVQSCDRATGTRRDLTLRRYIYIFAPCPSDDFDDHCIRFKGCVSMVCNCQIFTTGCKVWIKQQKCKPKKVGVPFRSYGQQNLLDFNYSAFINRECVVMAFEGQAPPVGIRKNVSGFQSNPWKLNSAI